MIMLSIPERLRATAEIGRTGKVRISLKYWRILFAFGIIHDFSADTLEEKVARRGRVLISKWWYINVFNFEIDSLELPQ
jgi:hypothetical protein